MFSTKNCVSVMPIFASSGPIFSSATLPTLLVVPGQVEHRDLRTAPTTSTNRDTITLRNWSVISYVSNDGSVATSSLEERRRVGDLEGVGAEGPQADRAELRVAEHDRVLRAPLLVGPLPRGDEVDLGLERRLEAVLPARGWWTGSACSWCRSVYMPGMLDVGELPFLDEARRPAPRGRSSLAPFLISFLYRGEAVRQDLVLARLGPFDDVDELAA